MTVVSSTLQSSETYREIDSTDPVLDVQARLGEFFSKHPNLLPVDKTRDDIGQETQRQYLRQAFRGDRRMSLGWFFDCLTAVYTHARRRKEDPDANVRYILAPLRLSLAVRPAKTVREELLDAHRSSCDLLHLVDVAAEDGDLSPSERRAIALAREKHFAEIDEVLIAVGAGGNA